MTEMITLEDLKPAEGSTKKSKKVGRGRASGHGKTSCRGHNGEGQRSGRTAKRGFEGGQMPAFRRIPKLDGFKNFNAINYAEITLSQISKLAKKGDISLEYLLEIKKVHPSSEGLRVLGNGELTEAVTVKANHFTASAKEKIEKAGGKAIII